MDPPLFLKMLKRRKNVEKTSIFEHVYISSDLEHSLFFVEKTSKKRRIEEFRRISSKKRRFFFVDFRRKNVEINLKI